MKPEQRIQHVEAMIARLQDDAEWLRQTGFWTEAASNDALVAEIEKAVEVYVSLFRESTRPTG
ncbi:hypothetical protein [Oryzifoliimicrobium ureilyticus]|uniref:hypothetical protein n=1 Tax=Oryzifoliimicrobium ureilyticus TaxID=3113724 RepID=UPI0030764281